MRPLLRLGLGLFLLSSTSARPDESESSVSDVTPELGLAFSNASESFALRGEGGILVTSGRAGFHRSDDAGQSWRRGMRGFVDPQGVEAFAGAFCQAPSAPSTAYGVAGAIGSLTIFEHVYYRTDDFGETWKPLGSIGHVALFDCAVDAKDPRVMYGITQNPGLNAALFKTTDGGHSFAKVGAGLPELGAFPLVRVSLTDPRNVYVVGSPPGEGVYASKDGGLSFQRLPAAPSNSFRLRPHPTQDGTLYVFGDGGLFRSTDFGASFTPLPAAPPNGGFLAFDPADTAIFYVAAGPDGLFRTRDGGTTFTRLGGPAPDQLGGFGVLSVGITHSRDHRTRLYVSTSFGPLRSDDGGETFLPIHRGYHGAAVTDLGFDATGRLLVGTFHTVGVFRGARPGLPAEYQIIGDKIPNGGQGETVSTVAASPVDPDVIIANNIVTGLFWTADGGRSWTQSTIHGNPSQLARMTFAPSDGRRVYLVNPRGRAGIYRSDDTGHSFAQLSNERLGAVAVDPSNADVIYAGAWENGRGLFKSTDGGHTLVQLAPPGNFSAIAVDKQNPQTVYAASRDGGVLRSTHGGASWDPAGIGLPGGEVLGLGIDPQRPARLFAWILGRGVFRSDDGAQTWKASNTGEALRRSGIEFARASFAVDPVRSGRVYIGMHGVVQIDTEE
jgi:photosystem II stability/assembly factor-like uncharacterized protein